MVRARFFGLCEISVMTDDNLEFVFNSELCARTKALREATGMTGEQMAIVLGVPVERYRKYENRSPLPSYLMQRFAITVGTSLEYLLTGKHAHQPILRAVDSRKKRA
jgi:DNA-binding XRE family transcriptional regulator